MDGIGPDSVAAAAAPPPAVAEADGFDVDLDRIQVLLDTPATGTSAGADALGERIVQLARAQAALDTHVRQLGDRVERLAATFDAAANSAVTLMSSAPEWSAMADAMSRLSELTSVRIANARRSAGLLRWSLALSLAVNLLLAAACFGPSGPWSLAALADQLPSMASLAGVPGDMPPARN